MAGTSTPDQSRIRPEFLQTIAAAIWHELPLLLAMSFALAVSAIPTMVLFVLELPMVALVVVVVMTGPVLSAIATTTDAIYLGRASSFGLFLRSIGHGVRSGISILAPIALVMGVLAGTIGIWARSPESRWLVMPVLLDTSLLIVLMLCAVSAFSLSATAGLEWRSMWKVSLDIFATSPVPTLGSIALLSLLAWLMVSYAPWFLVLLPAPWFLLNSAITSTSVGTQQAVRPDQCPDQHEIR